MNTHKTTHKERGATVGPRTAEELRDNLLNDFLNGPGGFGYAGITGDQLRAGLLAIEEAAYKEGRSDGRQQAVRAIEAEIRRDAEDFTGYGAEWMRQRILNHRIPAAVAGLNASEHVPESPPTGKRHYHGDTLYDRAIECYDVHGDASEHAPESGQPPEASGLPTDCPLCERDVAFFFKQQRQLHDHRHLHERSQDPQK